MPSQIDSVLAVLSGEKSVNVDISPRASAILFAVVFGGTLLALVIAHAWFKPRN